MRLPTLLFGGSGGGGAVADLGLAILRVFAGVSMALAHGMGKIPPSQRFMEGVAGMGFPFPSFFAWAAGMSEFFGGLMLAAGLLTRPSACFLAATMGVAALVRHAPDPYGSKELPLLYLAAFLAFALAGSGRFGLDELLRRRFSSRSVG